MTMAEGIVLSSTSTILSSKYLWNTHAYQIHLSFLLTFRLKLVDQETESHIRAVVAITTLMKNAPDLGSGQIGKDGVLQLMLAMARSEDKVQQIVAAEALIAASAKKKDTNMIVSQVSNMDMTYHISRISPGNGDYL